MTTATAQIDTKLAGRTDEQLVSDYTTACISAQAARGTDARQGWGVITARIEREMERRGLGDIIEIVLDETCPDELAAA